MGILDQLFGNLNTGPIATQGGQPVGPVNGGMGILGQIGQRLGAASPELMGFGMGMLSGATPGEGWANAATQMNSNRQQANRDQLLAQQQQERLAKQQAATDFMKRNPELTKQFGSLLADPETAASFARAKYSNDLSADNQTSLQKNLDYINGLKDPQAQADARRALGISPSITEQQWNLLSPEQKMQAAQATNGLQSSQWQIKDIEQPNGQKQSVYVMPNNPNIQPRNLDGTPYTGSAGTTNPYAMNGKATNDQTNAATYANRTAEAHKILTQNEDINKGGVLGIGPSVAGMLPNSLKTDNRQQVEQAQRDFVNAILRKESGAAISESEFENARKQYFPQPGDGQGVIEQKRANRETAIKGMMGAAGPNFKPPEDWASGQSPQYSKPKLDVGQSTQVSPNVTIKRVR